MTQQQTFVGEMIDLAYGRSLSAENRHAGSVPVFGSNGLVGHHNASAVDGPGIIVGRKGSVGALAFSDRPFWPIDTTYYVVNKGAHDWRFLFHLLRSLGLSGLNSHSAVPGLNREDVYTIPVSLPSREDEPLIGRTLDAVEGATNREQSMIAALQGLKRAAMRELFTRGLRGEAQKDSDIGLVPDSWDTPRIDQVADIISTRMTYGALLSSMDCDPVDDGARVLGIKVADMNPAHAATVINDAQLVGYVPKDDLSYRCAPPGTIVFPKNGAAVATNKKRMLGDWGVFDPNVMGLLAKDQTDQRFLFHWMLAFDLASIVKPGPVPHFNKSDLAPVRLPMPTDTKERDDIVVILEAIDFKIDLHKRKKTILEELFRALLHKLMTGQICVADLDLSALAPCRSVAA